MPVIVAGATTGATQTVAASFWVVLEDLELAEIAWSEDGPLVEQRPVPEEKRPDCSALRREGRFVSRCAIAATVGTSFHRHRCRMARRRVLYAS